MLQRLLLNFIQKRFAPGSLLLLGYSGGPDSKALLSLMLEAKQKLPFALHLAHVNHNWRRESRGELELLRAEAEGLGLPFHFLECDPHAFSSGNLEAQGRTVRYRFFSTLYRKLGCAALFLAHHADDQAETVAKRLFEGAPLMRMGGLVPDAERGGMRICRPLLAVKKEKLRSYIKKKGWASFEDPTNRDSRFLRGRMRKDLFPFLSESFGKECAHNFVQLGAYAQQLHAYFFDKINHLIPQNGEEVLKLPENRLHPLELEWLLREWLARSGCALSREGIQGLVASTLDGRERRFPIKGKKGYVRTREEIVEIEYF